MSFTRPAIIKIGALRQLTNQVFTPGEYNLKTRVRIFDNNYLQLVIDVKIKLTILRESIENCLG